MNLIPLLVAAVAVLPIFAASVWLWFATLGAEDELRSLVDLDAMRFED